ncbi:hypothetical protein Lser_V15G10949 [Lactuca serriola]
MLLYVNIYKQKPLKCKKWLVFLTPFLSGQLLKLPVFVAHPLYELQMLHSVQHLLFQLAFLLSLLLLNPLHEYPLINFAAPHLLLLMSPVSALFNTDPKAFLLAICMAASISLEDSRAVEFAAVTTADTVPSFAELFPANEFTASL